jgi:asparaginyl-tRNA synthetase
VRDGTGTIQCVVFVKDVAPEVFERAGHVPQESSLEVTGTVRADARSPLGFELAVKDVRVLQEASDYPITPKEHGPAFLLDHRHSGSLVAPACDHAGPGKRRPGAVATTSTRAASR